MVWACRVVGDLMKSAGMRLGSVAELETYIRRPRNIGNASSIPVWQPALWHHSLQGHL